jgi:hypothetical protein
MPCFRHYPPAKIRVISLMNDSNARQKNGDIVGNNNSAF